MCRYVIPLALFAIFVAGCGSSGSGKPVSETTATKPPKPLVLNVSSPTANLHIARGGDPVPIVGKVNQKANVQAFAGNLTGQCPHSERRRVVRRHFSFTIPSPTALHRVGITICAETLGGQRAMEVRHVAIGVAPAAQETSKPKTKPAAKPQLANTENQACGGYVGPDLNACHDSYEYLCMYGKVKQTVQNYYENNGTDLSTAAVSWAKDYYTSGGSWQAGSAGCLAALMDEYRRLYG